MRFFAALSLSLLAPLAIPSAHAQTVVPVQFERGASSATIAGSIEGREYADYRIVVRAGQHLSVRLTPTGGSPYFNLLEPGSRDVAIFNGSMNGQSYAGTTTRAGAYTIRVYQMRASGRRGETARFTLDIAVRGSSAGAHSTIPSHRPGDALVAGTPYHATASIMCRASAGAGMGTCKAGVIRRGGSATVHLDTPDGGERTILFRGGKAVSSDSQAGLTVMRRRDVSIVRIGTVEIYEIPDALIEGG